ncbi:probable receptor-like protein kinase At1g30570 [Magnolia sinica]|uniref:probable receptor-like protein kinase At1g30570 n=1 Tax=Magnolia sinica TaxID=86752 RepID=UPI00265B2CF0|nr:probable receptor-like protein kinase At1g30570 [Magnolia sinica]
MEACRLIFIVLMHVFIGIAQAQTDPFLIDCGTNSSIIVDGRRWVGDLNGNNTNVTLSSPGISASTATVSGNSVYGSLYKTARIFSSPSNYTFRVLSGEYYVRLHFYPFPFNNNLNVNTSKFDVLANNLRLVSGFNVVDEISWKNTYLAKLGSNSTVSALMKEYFLTIKTAEILIKFVPASGTFAFVNAIEIVPVLSRLFPESAVKVAGNGANVSLVDKGIETMYRLNVAGQEIAPGQDRDLWRRWESDDNYIFAASASAVIKNSSNISYAYPSDVSVAPILVYEDARTMTNAQVMDNRFNMSWKFIVDPNFDYLVRLHFCELYYDKANQRIFKIYINNQTAAENFDVFVRAGGLNKAYHEDYIDLVSPQLDTLWVQLGPDPSAGGSGTEAILNALEILKLSRNGNLAHTLEIFDSGGKGAAGKNSKRILLVVIGAGVAAFAVLSALCIVIFCFCKKKKMSGPIKTESPRWRPLVLQGILGSTNDVRASKFPSMANGSMATTRIGKRFTVAEIRAATKNFDESLVIGTGGFGKVYKGVIEDGSLVAIKRAHPQSQQGLAEFETEIEMLSKLRHRHLVSMIGYCEEHNEMILVYEYMANGTLRSHLFGSDLPPLPWKQRLEACIGAARGLHYLHTGLDGGIIHRDVKTTNILLDENFVAKVADFGLSKTGPSLDRTHVSTAVKGSFGYLDPEYFRRQQLTDKSDVYSFGVVLFEVVCARPVINPTLPRDQINLAEWAVQWQRKGSLETIVDPKLEGKYSLESLKKFGEIAEKCLADEGKNRPTMGEVLWHLEYVLQLHEAYTRSDTTGESLSRSEVRFTNPLSLPAIGEGEYQSSSLNPLAVDMGPTYEGESSAGTTSEDAIGVVDFSQLVHPQGR